MAHTVMQQLLIQKRPPTALVALDRLLRQGGGAAAQCGHAQSGETSVLGPELGPELARRGPATGFCGTAALAAALLTGTAQREGPLFLQSLRKRPCDRRQRLVVDLPIDLVLDMAGEGATMQNLPVVGKGTRSGCQNIKLAIVSYDGVPCRHGNTGSLTLRHLGTDTPRSTGLYNQWC